MVGKGTQGLRVVSSLLYFLAFAMAGLIIGIFSFFIARLVQHDSVRRMPFLLTIQP